MDKNLGGGMESPGRLSIPGTSSLPAGGILEHLGVCCVKTENMAGWGHPVWGGKSLTWVLNMSIKDPKGTRAWACS